MPPASSSATTAPPCPPSIQPSTMTRAVMAAIRMKTLAFPCIGVPYSFGASRRSAARINAGVWRLGSRACACASATACAASLAA